MKDNTYIYILSTFLESFPNFSPRYFCMYVHMLGMEYHLEWSLQWALCTLFKRRDKLRIFPCSLVQKNEKIQEIRGAGEEKPYNTCCLVPAPRLFFFFRKF